MRKPGVTRKRQATTPVLAAGGVAVVLAGVLILGTNAELRGKASAGAWNITAPRDCTAYPSAHGVEAICEKPDVPALSKTIRAGAVTSLILHGSPTGGPADLSRFTNTTSVNVSGDASAAVIDSAGSLPLLRDLYLNNQSSTVDLRNVGVGLATLAIYGADRAVRVNGLEHLGLDDLTLAGTSHAIADAAHAISPSHDTRVQIDVTGDATVDLRPLERAGIFQVDVLTNDSSRAVISTSEHTDLLRELPATGKERPAPTGWSWEHQGGHGIVVSYRAKK